MNYGVLHYIQQRPSCILTPGRVAHPFCNGKGMESEWLISYLARGGKTRGMEWVTVTFWECSSRAMTLSKLRPLHRHSGFLARHAQRLRANVRSDGRSAFKKPESRKGEQLIQYSVINRWRLRHQKRGAVLLRAFFLLAVQSVGSMMPFRLSGPSASTIVSMSSITCMSNVQDR